MGEIKRGGANFAFQAEMTKGDRKVTVWRDKVWQEYRVQLVVDGVYQEGADYHTDDSTDALGTATAMLKS